MHWTFEGRGDEEIDTVRNAWRAELSRDEKPTEPKVTANMDPWLLKVETRPTPTRSPIGHSDDRASQCDQVRRLLDQASW